MTNCFPDPLGEEPAITVSRDRDLITVIERFEVTSAEQQEAIEKAADHMVETWKPMCDFIGAMLHRGRDHGGLSCDAQWRTPTDKLVPATPPASRSLASALSTFEVLDSRTYTVDFTDQAQSVTPPARMSVTLTPCAHFGIFSVQPENQARMLKRARDNAPKSLKTSGLVAISFHRSIDELQVVNLGIWTSFDEFQSLVRQPGFRDDYLYWEGVASFQPVFFDVVGRGRRLTHADSRDLR